MIRRRDGDVRLGPDLVGEAVVENGSDPARVAEFVGDGGLFYLDGDAVARHPGLVVNDGDAASGKTIENSRLADVGTADDGEAGEEFTGHQNRGGCGRTLSVGGCHHQGKGNRSPP